MFVSCFFRDSDSIDNSARISYIIAKFRINSVEDSFFDNPLYMARFVDGLLLSTLADSKCLYNVPYAYQVAVTALNELANQCVSKTLPILFISWSNSLVHYSSSL